ncbi:MAG: GNAT family N-acetyltransferase [Flavobacteriales bacterium]|nr:GNAT family N-acetyltransferase [Flavobacteriales bacterium]
MMIGCGNMGAAILESLLKAGILVERTTLCVDVAETRDAVARRYPGSRVLYAEEVEKGAHGTDLVVPPHWMGEGVGTALLRALLAEMERNGATAQVVLAPTESLGFFERFGFRAEGDLIRYTGGRHVQAALQEVVSVAPEHWLGICHLDRRATGEDRSRWLREHDYLAKVWLELGRVRGFLLPLAGDGLIIADAPYIGLELQRWLLPVRDHITLPAGQEQVHAHLVKQGYVPEPHAVRLVRGAPLPWRPEMVYGW